MRIVAIAALVLGFFSMAHGQDWTPTTSNGERAFASETGALRAVVSVERARLVYFGPKDGAHNLLLAPPTRDAPGGWGGQRLWLGPQTEWGWPPPAPWESRAAERAATHDGKLELFLGDAGHGWPRLARVYFWESGELHCDARISGGTRAAQIIQIFQTPTNTLPELMPTLSARAPRGYTQVHMGRTPSPAYEFPLPPHVEETKDGVRLKFLNRTEKLGFQSQPIVAVCGDIRWSVRRGASAGKELSLPDDGYATQVFLGSGPDQVIELEQLSPLFAAGTDAHFEVVLRVE